MDDSSENELRCSIENTVTVNKTNAQQRCHKTPAHIVSNACSECHKQRSKASNSQVAEIQPANAKRFNSVMAKTLVLDALLVACTAANITFMFETQKKPW